MIIKKNRQKKLREVKKAETEITDVSDSVVPENTSEITEEVPVSQPQQTQETEPEIDLFDIENIDFNQREERRRGTRRRGYRRIDDRNLVSRAHEEAEFIKQSAFEEGYRKGLEQAQADINDFKNKVTTFMNAPKEVFEYIAPDLLEMSVNIARKIIKTEVTSEPQVLMNTIIDVLKTISKSEAKVNIRVKPQAVPFIKDSLPNITYEYGIDAKINVIADPSVDDGGCVFQTNNGIVDASVDTQLEIIKKALEGA